MTTGPFRILLSDRFANPGSNLTDAIGGAHSFGKCRSRTAPTPLPQQSIDDVSPRDRPSSER